jgi:hypothetical protein
MLSKIMNVDFPAGWEEKWGGYNDFPPNWHEITEAEFAQSHFFIYSPDYVEFRQMFRKHDTVVGATLYFMYDGVGYGIVHDYWGRKIHYYKFALCEHKFTELTQKECAQKGIQHFGNCYHVYRCTKCGFTNSVDSSG